MQNDDGHAAAAVAAAKRLVELLGQSIDSIDDESIFRSDRQSAITTKTFGQVTYRSANRSGISLQFEQGTCHAIDLYNEGASKGWSSFTSLPLLFSFTKSQSDVQQHTFALDRHTCGRTFVQAFGEPERKGGGEPLKGGGASGMGPGVWMEWQCMCISGKHVYLMIELMGEQSRGAHRWEKGGEAIWGICTLSLPPLP